MELTTPLVLHQEVALEDGLNDEVVLIVTRLEQVLLHDCELGFVDANQAALSFCNGHFLAYLQVAIE